MQIDFHLSTVCADSGHIIAQLTPEEFEAERLSRRRVSESCHGGKASMCCACV